MPPAGLRAARRVPPLIGATHKPCSRAKESIAAASAAEAGSSIARGCDPSGARAARPVVRTHSAPKSAARRSARFASRSARAGSSLWGNPQAAAGLTSPQTAPVGNIFPGFNSPAPSKACFRRVIAAISSGENTSGMRCRFRGSALVRFTRVPRNNSAPFQGSERKHHSRRRLYSAN